MDDNVIKKVKEVLNGYVGGEVEIVETRRDPILSYSMAVRTKSNGCFIVVNSSNGWQVHDEFLLDEGKETLQDLEASDKGLAESIFL